MEYYTNINHRIFKVWSDLAKKEHDQEISFDITDQVLISTIKKYADPELSPGLERNENGYVWLKHSYLIDQLYFLKIKEDALKKRLKNYIDIGILKREHEFTNRNNYPSKKAYYKVTGILNKIELILKKYDEIEKSNISKEEKTIQKNKLKFPDIPRKVNNSLTKNNQKRDKKGKFVSNNNNRKVNKSLTDSVSQSLTSGETNPLHQGKQIPLDSYTTDYININKETKYKETSKDLAQQIFNYKSHKEIPQHITDEEIIKRREENRKKFDLKLLYEN